MKRSEDRILTTHVGSLPRPPALRDLLIRQDRGEAVDAAALAREAEAAVRHVVRKQLEAGVDVGNDGEEPHVGFSTYPARRMRGFGGESKRRLSRDQIEHPDYASRCACGSSGGAARGAGCPMAQERGRREGARSSLRRTSANVSGVASIESEISPTSPPVQVTSTVRSPSSA